MREADRSPRSRRYSQKSFAGGPLTPAWFAGLRRERVEVYPVDTRTMQRLAAHATKVAVADVA